MTKGSSRIYSLCFTVVLLLVQRTVCVSGSLCKFGRDDINVQGTPEYTSGQYVDLQHPLTCSGSIVAWHFCYYTVNIQPNRNYRVYFRVFSNENSDQLKLIHQVTVNLRLNPSNVGGNSSMCNSLDQAASMNVSNGDYLAAYMPTLSQPLLVVGGQIAQSVVYVDTRSFPQPFDSDTVPLSVLQGVEGAFFHLHADVVSPDERVVASAPNPHATTSFNIMPTQAIPIPTQNPLATNGSREGNENTNTTGTTSGDDDNSSINSAAVAAIAVVASFLFLMALLLLFLVLGIVLYRRWKMEHVKKALLEIHPPHLAIDNATYDLPMLAQDYRVFKSMGKNKSRESREPAGRLSTASENIYETQYDEGIAEVFGLYASMGPSSAEFRSSVKKVVTTLSKTKPTPYQLPAAHEQQIYQQISGQQVPSLSAKHIQAVGQLGSGQFANVEKAVWSRSHSIIEVAVKTLHNDASPTDKLKLLQEGAITSQFRHPNVISLYGIITDNNKVSLVMEYVSKGDLKGCLTNIRTNSDDMHDTSLSGLLLSYSIQVALGMLYLSDKGFVHRDLAARNILVSVQDVCKIADFGMSRDLADAEYYIAEGGTIPIRWTAPEAVYYRKYSTASDVWSYGCVLYEIWSLGHKPFEGCSNTQLLREISIGFRLPPPPGCPYRAYDIMIKCWHPNHVKRPSFEEALRSLLDDEQTVLDIPSEDAATHEKAVCLGADLQAGHKMYSQLQAVYIPNSASISQRPSSIALVVPHTAEEKGDNYETIDMDNNSPSHYVNGHSRGLKDSTEEDDSSQRYGNVDTQGKARVEEVIYDDVDYNSSKSGASGNEKYYNVVAAGKVRDEIYTDTDNVLETNVHSCNRDTSRKRVPPLAPKPAPRKHASATNSLPFIESDYYEAGESTFTINNDQIVV